MWSVDGRALSSRGGPALRRALWASACGCTLPSRSSSRSPPPERATPWSRAHIRRARTETQPHAHAPRGFAAAVSLRYGTEVRPKVRSFRYVCAAHSAGGATAAQSAATLDAFLDRVIEHRCAAESVARTAAACCARPVGLWIQTHASDAMRCDAMRCDAMRWLSV